MRKRILFFIVSLLTLLAFGTQVSTAKQKPGSIGHETFKTDPKPTKVSKKHVPRAKTAAAFTCDWSVNNSDTYLHVCRATYSSFDWVEYDCCRVIERYGYKRFNAERVDINVRAYRSGTTQCRWVINRGVDTSHYTYYHPDSKWHTCGL